MPQTIRKGQKDRIWIRRKLEQADNSLDKAMLHLIEVREPFNKQSYDKYVEQIDTIGETLLMIQDTIRAFRESI